jgi:hypothetical protein
MPYPCSFYRRQDEDWLLWPRHGHRNQLHVAQHAAAHLTTCGIPGLHLRLHAEELQLLLARSITWNAVHCSKCMHSSSPLHSPMAVA